MIKFNDLARAEKALVILKDASFEDCMLHVELQE